MKTVARSAPWSNAPPTTPPSASCVNSDPIGLVNVVTCTINTTVQDKLVFKQALVDALHHLDVDIIDDVTVSKVLVKLL
ncbi:hypothetical protein [Actinosynnema mirum]|uniref:hypothetical protein n=1 Tax=Actinosynnema mirum TaxID=40567 RepID=UPI00032482B2|nr:hypothetical protein [Actinosynnema mirum]